MSDDLSCREKLKGIVRLFPLPNVVVFPFAYQALHIFEPRYRQMTADALAGDRLIAMALLRPGWEADYAGRPALYPMACLGHIAAHQRLEDGRYDLRLRGLSRVRILEEINTGKLYRSARVELVDDVQVGAPDRDRELRRRLSREVLAWYTGQEEIIEAFEGLLQSRLPLEVLCDLAAFSFPLPVEAKQELLETLDVEQRVERLFAHMAAHPLAAAAKDYGPDFSDN
jgi:Lon protease-like protein